MIVFRRQVQGRSVTSEAGDDPAMLFCKARCVKGQPELLPPQVGIRDDSGLFFDRESMYHGRQCADGLLHAFIRRSELKSGIERFEVTTEFRFQSREAIGCRRGSFGHNIQHDDTA